MPKPAVSNHKCTTTIILKTWLAGTTS